METKPPVKWLFYAALAGFIASLAVMLPVAISLTDSANTTSRANSLANCFTTASSRPYGNARAFAQRETQKIADAAFQQFPVKFRQAEDREISQDWQEEQTHLKIDGKLPTGIPSEVNSFSEMTGLEPDLPLINCTKVVSH